ncbi:MAG: type II toxin-antitoxin system RelE family toxin [Rubrobacteraceae bacterium]
MPEDYRVIIAPQLLEQLEEFGIVEQARSAIRDAMANPEKAGKQLTGSLYPYRRLRVGRYRIIYRVASDANPPEARFLQRTPYRASRKPRSPSTPASPTARKSSERDSS